MRRDMRDCPGANQGPGYQFVDGGVRSGKQTQPRYKLPVVSQFSNRGLCVKRFCKPLVCRASAGSWFSPRSAHGRRMMGRRGSAFQGLKRGPRAAAN